MSAFEQPPDLHQKSFHEILTDFLENRLNVLQIYNMQEMVNFMGFFVNEIGEGTNFLNFQQEKANVIAPNQEGENTCYAYACARSIYFACKRIAGRSEEDIPDFESLVEVMMCAYGKNGANCYDVLKIFVEEYRLRVMTIGPPSLTDYIAQRTPVAQFTLNNEHWGNFDRYATNPLLLARCSLVRPQLVLFPVQLLLLVMWESNQRLTLMRYCCLVVCSVKNTTKRFMHF